MNHVLARSLYLIMLLLLAVSVTACDVDDDPTPTINSSVTPTNTISYETTAVEVTSSESSESAAPDTSVSLTQVSTIDTSETSEDASTGELRSGLLVATGTGFIHTYDLETDSSWQRRLSYAGPWSTVALIEADRELLIASTSGAEPVIITSYDIDSFGRKDAFEWPDSTSTLRVHSLAATADGRYFALIMEAFEPYLEIVERDTGRVIYTGLDIATGAGMAWTADHTLIVPLDLSYEEDSDRWGAIGMFSLENLENAEDRDVDGQLLVTFSRAEWGHRGPEDLALSADNSELVYSLAGDLWVVDLDPGASPHQLTTGPRGQFGAAFAPNGEELALVIGDNLGLRDTYVISNHREEPILPEAAETDGAGFVLETSTLVDNILSWLE